jgi:hypothetical protein
MVFLEAWELKLWKQQQKQRQQLSRECDAEKNVQSKESSQDGKISPKNRQEGVAASSSGGGLEL